MMTVRELIKSLMNYPLDFKTRVATNIVVGNRTYAGISGVVGNSEGNALHFTVDVDGAHQENAVEAGLAVAYIDPSSVMPGVHINTLESAQQKVITAEPELEIPDFDALETTANDEAIWNKFGLGLHDEITVFGFINGTRLTVKDAGDGLCELSIIVQEDGTTCSVITDGIVHRVLLDDLRRSKRSLVKLSTD